MLSVTSNLINVNNIGTYELSNIYKYIFDKYVPNYDIRINNLFIYGVNHIKEHFALFSYNNNYYSYNYNKGAFINMDCDVLYDNIKNKRIGIYDNEEFDLVEKRAVL